MSKTINTILVLRNDSTTAWESSTVVLKKGELGVGYLDNGNVIVKSGDGTNTWAALPQVEGVFEDDLTITYAFGKYSIPASGSLRVDAKGMTTSQWLKNALAETKDPTVTNPTFSLSASATGNGGEVGTKVTALTWNGTFTDGKYTYGTQEFPTSTSAGLTKTFVVSNNVNSDTSTNEDGTFTLASADQITLGDDTVSKTITSVCSYSGSRMPLNNIGETVSGKKIADGSISKTATINIKGYRKPFWGIQAAAADLKVATDYESADVRALSNSGTSAAGLPTTLLVPAGSQQVCFFAKAGTKSTLVAKDTNAMNATVAFTKVANAVNVQGANSYNAVAYDLWYVNWGAGIDAAKNLSLTWS